MAYCDGLYAVLKERKKTSEELAEWELEINKKQFVVACHGVERAIVEKGIIKVEPLAANMSVLIGSFVSLPFELCATSHQLELFNGEFLFHLADSAEKGRVVSYQIESLDDDDDDDDDENSRKKYVRGIAVNKSGEYPFGKGTMLSEQRGRKLVISLGDVQLVVEGFGPERTLMYSQKMYDRDYFIVEIRSQEAIQRARRMETLNIFQKIACQINGDEHGMAKGISRILHTNDVEVALPSEHVGSEVS
jgi:hypothetical protein